MSRSALVFGISGQDGSLLARLLLELGYEVHGTSRDAQIASFGNLTRLSIQDQVRLHSAVPTDFRSVLQVLTDSNPDEIYFLAGQSSVGLSFQQPVETLESIALGTLNLLEAIRFSGSRARLYNAASGECFGERSWAADETAPFRPRSPYAIAKASSFWTVANHREAYGIHACSGILFNHESPLRPERFVTRKVVATACRIAAGSDERLYLGNLAIERDWGWAPDYVAAMHAMLQLPEPQDLVIATGITHSLEMFISLVFATVGLDWREHVESDASLLRPTDLRRSFGDAARAEEMLGWRSELSLEEITRHLVDGERGLPWPVVSEFAK